MLKDVLHRLYCLWQTDDSELRLEIGTDYGVLTSQNGKESLFRQCWCFHVFLRLAVEPEMSYVTTGQWRRSTLQSFLISLRKHCTWWAQPRTLLSSTPIPVLLTHFKADTNNESWIATVLWQLALICSQYLSFSCVCMYEPSYSSLEGWDYYDFIRGKKGNGLKRRSTVECC